VQGLGVFRSRSFWKLFASLGALVAFTTLVAGLLADHWVASAIAEDIVAALEDECVLSAPLAERALGEPKGGEVQDRLVELGRASGLRLTVVRADGRVLADSSGDPADMSDHGSRPEIVAARVHRVGTSERLSDTLGIPMVYVARRIDQDGRTLGFVRVAMPSSAKDERLRASHRAVLVGAGAGLVLALLLGLVIAQRTTRPIAGMASYAQELRAGRYDARIEVHADGEVGLLAEALQRLGHETAERIATISQDDAQLRAMLAGMVEGVIAVDEQDRVAFCNAAARSQLGIETAEPTGRRLWELAPITDLEALLTQARETGSMAHREIELHRTGAEQVLDTHASPYRSGNRSGLVVVLHDISALRRLERVRRDFVANVSHELKTPLTAIRGFVETLLAGAVHDQENNVRFLRRIDANVERLSNLVTDLLSLARIEAQEGRVEKHPVDWRPVLTEVLRRHEDALVGKGLQREVTGTEEPLIVLGDAEAMTQILENLVDNAIKYTPAPGRVRIELARRDGRGVVTVEDTGVGIPPQDLDRIFERFYRVDKARSREVGGTGLGLSIVKHLVASLDGQVGVESKLGKGTRFTVEIPLAGAS
jgi:two-component system phosphate regulon sensor histidine kinase PhoR